MKVRVLTEQRADPELDREHLASGQVYDLPNAWARELLVREDAEPVAEKRAAKAEKRPAAKRGESR